MAAQQDLRKTYNLYPDGPNAGPIWRIFRRNGTDKTDPKALCYWCHELLAYNESAEALKKHIVRKHMNQLLRYVPLEKVDTQTSILDTLSKQQRALQQSSTLTNDVTSALLVWAADTGVPIHALQHPSFRFNVLQRLNADFVLPSDTTLSSKVKQLAAQTVAPALEALKSFAAKIPFAVDVWEASDNSGFLTVECFYTDSNWNICHHVLGFKRLPLGRSTASDLAAVIRDLFEASKLTQQLYSMTSDTTNLMPATARLMQTNWIPCVIHQGNLVFKHAINETTELSAILTKVHHLVNWTRTKKKALELFKELQYRKKAEKVLKPITNWSPRFMVETDVLQRFLTTAPLWAGFLQEYQTMNPHEQGIPTQYLLTYDEVGVISSLLPLLKRFQQLFYELEGETKPLSVIYYPSIIRFVSADLVIQPSSDGRALQELKKCIEKQWLKYFENQEQYRIELVAASWCDPFYHLRWLDTLHQLSPESGFLQLKARAKEYIYNLALDCYRWHLKLEEDSRPTVVDDFAFLPEDADAMQVETSATAYLWSDNMAQPSCSSSNPAPFSNRSTSARHEQQSSSIAVPNIEQKLREEMDLFERKVAEYKIEQGPTNALQAWRAFSPRAPNVARAVRILLSTPISSASCERDFSASKALFTNQRRRMSDSNLEAFVQIRRRNDKVKK